MRGGHTRAERGKERNVPGGHEGSHLPLDPAARVYAARQHDHGRRECPGFQHPSDSLELAVPPRRLRACRCRTPQHQTLQTHHQPPPGVRVGVRSPLLRQV